MGFFHPLVTFLGLDGQGGNGPGFQSGKSDGFACLQAVAVGPFFDSFQGLINFDNQLAGAKKYG